jgi:V8-like Glu-specific endopeptidase
MKKEVKLCVITILTVVMLWQLSVESAHAIVNGVPDGNTHPYVGMMVFKDTNGDLWRCSGFLISPTVFLTAGHCTIDTVEAWISFDENLQNIKYTTFPCHSTRFYTKMPYDGSGPGLPGFAAGYDVGNILLPRAESRS